MAKFRDGLAKDGRIYVFRFWFKGRIHKGSTGCQDKDSAALWLKAYRDALSLKTVGISGDPVYTLKETLDAWVKTHTNTRAKSYVNGVESVIRLHCVPLHNLPLKAITTRQVEAVVGAYPGNAGGVAYLLRYLRRLCFWGGLDKLPYKVRGPKIQENPAPWLDKSQMGAFLDALAAVVKAQRAGPSNDVVPMCRLILALGLREDECLTARVEWLDRVKWICRPGKTKNGKVRILDVPVHLRAELDARCSGKAHGLLFPGRFGGKRKRGYLLPFVTKAGEAIGLRGLSPHRLRVSWATMMHQAPFNVPLADLQVALGHESIKTTMLYVKTKGEALKTASVMMGEFMQGGLDRVEGVPKIEPEHFQGLTIN